MTPWAVPYGETPPADGQPPAHYGVMSALLLHDQLEPTSASLSYPDIPITSGFASAVTRGEHSSVPGRLPSSEEGSHAQVGDRLASLTPLAMGSLPLLASRISSPTLAPSHVTEYV